MADEPEPIQEPDTIYVGEISPPRNRTEQACGNCGFLLLSQTNGRMAIAPESFREHGIVAAFGQWDGSWPKCAQQLRSFPPQDSGPKAVINSDQELEFEDIQGGWKWLFKPTMSQIHAVIREHFICSDFSEYKLGATLAGYRAVLDRKWMLDREREWREKDQQTQDKLVNKAGAAARWQKISAVATAIAVLVAAIAFVWQQYEDNQHRGDTQYIAFVTPSSLALTPEPKAEASSTP